ncbi:MAG TPA: hypothetical protein VE643_07490, partial [Nitrososphaeraceae archaeon]|nr:hypothetical protein [Nitrososphaeraceae archaeon]
MLENNIYNIDIAFACLASEDKEQVARPLAKNLTSLGFNVWYDEFILKGIFKTGLKNTCVSSY